VIASHLPPSRFLGSVGTSIHTPAFNCFISTARSLFSSRRWQTAIIKGDPGVDKHCQMFTRLFYRRGLEKIVVWKIHDALATHIDGLGDSGIPLNEAINSLLLDEVFAELFRRGIIEPPLQP
jgi:hypothetical protein